MTPGMGSPRAGGSDGRHDDEAVLTEFLSSLMDYSPTVRWRSRALYTRSFHRILRLIRWRGRFRTSWWSTTLAAAASTPPTYACKY
jgi:hypothetical protein